MAEQGTQGEHARALRGVGIGLQTRGEDFCRGGKIKHNAVFTHEAAVFLRKHHAAPGRYDGAGSGDLPEDGAFPLAEPFPAFAGHDVGNRFSCCFLQIDVGVHIAAAEPSRQRPAKGRLARGACTDEINRMSHQPVLEKRNANRAEKIDERFMTCNRMGRNLRNLRRVEASPRR